MIEEVLPEIWNIAVNDPPFRVFWASAQDVEPRLYLGMAPDDAPMPYVNYDISGGDGESNSDLWAMSDNFLVFSVYDFGPSKARCLAIANRIKQLYSMRGYLPDQNKAACVRSYEPTGPKSVGTESKLVSRYDITFPLRGYDVAAADAKIHGTR